MKLRAQESELNIFELFCHDDDATSTRPFDGWEVARVLNETAELDEVLLELNKLGIEL